MTNEYAAALAAHNAAQAAFRIVRDAYRAGHIGDDQFIAARKAYDLATTEFDIAYEAEYARAAVAFDASRNVA